MNNMNEMISSSQNKTIKLIKSLHAKKYRDEFNQYIIESYKLIEEAMEYKRHFSLLLLSEGAFKSKEGQSLLHRAETMQIPLYIASDKVFADASELDTPQGVLAVLYKQEQKLDSILSMSSYSLIVLDEVRDPGNVGTIIRTADACGLTAVVLTKGCVDLYNAKTIRATMGSMFHIPVITDASGMELLQALKQNGAAVLGADPHSKTNCMDVKRPPKLAIVIGNEANGIKDEIKAITTQNITIPMPGKAESLNAGIAAAILMYEFTVRKSK